ncbi:RHS repeat protein [Oxalobacteraceae bacterium]|nr:RHS repeat protein [Oxalobacteraceae bacterium]
MVAIVSGKDLGLSTGSAGVLGQQGVFGNAVLGNAREAAYVNAASGSLILQDSDDFLAARGVHIALTRTYNSLGSFNDGHGGWKVGPSRQVTNLTGTLETTGSTVTRIDSDGSAALYTYDATLGLYRSTDGGGGYDYLRMNSASEWIWTSERRDMQGLYEVYDSTKNAGHITSSHDQNGLQADQSSLLASYTYEAGQLSLVTNAAGDKVYYSYTDGNLSQIRTVPADTGQQSSKILYTYDSNRLSTVTIDLTPGDSADAKTYTTTYTYRGTSNQIASVTQADGTTLTFGYTQLPATTGPWLLTMVTDGLGQKTTYDYSVPGSTTVADPMGYKTVYKYDLLKGQLTDVIAPAVAGVNQKTSFVYDADGNILCTTDPRGLTTVYQYDGNGNRIYERNAAGNTVTRSYDPVSNKLLTETVYLLDDPDGAGPQLPSQPLTTNYVYDSKNRLHFIISPEGRVQEYRYDTQGQRKATLQYTVLSTVPLGTNANAQSSATDAAMTAWTTSSAVAASLVNRTDYNFDVHGLVSKSSSYLSLGGGDWSGEDLSTKIYAYDARGLLLKTIDGNGNTNNFTYDGLGRLLSSGDATGFTTTAYNAAGNSISTTVTAYNPPGSSVSTTPGLITNSTYDKNGHLTSVVKTDAAASALGTTTNLYNNDGLLWKSTDGTGLVSYTIYDAAGRKVADISPTRALTEYRYNLDNQVSRVVRYDTLVSIIPTSPTTTLSAVLPATSAADRSNWNLYDSAGRLSESVDAIGNLSHYDYDGASRLLQVVQRATPLTPAQLSALASVNIPNSFPSTASAADRTTRKLYDNDGLALAQLDAQGYLTEYRYDGAGRLLDTIAYANATPAAERATGTLATLRPAASAADQRQRYFYNAQGQVAAVIDAAGILTETGYDNAGNVVRVTRYATAVSNPGAATLAAIGKTVSADDLQTAYTYTARNQRLTEVSTDGSTTRYTYDNAGNVTEVRRALSSADERSTQMRFDLLGNVIAQLTPQGVALLAGAATQVQIDKVWTDNALQYTYNADGMRTSMKDQFGKKTFYYYDGNGRLAYTVDPSGAVLTRTYNAFGQLSKLRMNTALIAAATLATLKGGIVDSTITGAAAPVAADGVEAFAYDKAGQLIDDTNPLGGHTLYNYDAFGKVVQVVQTDAAAQQLGITNNTYDADGRLLRSSQNGAATYYVYDAFGRVTGTVAPNGALTEYCYNAANQLTRTKQYATPVNPTPLDNQGQPVTLTIALLRAAGGPEYRSNWSRYDTAGRLLDSVDAEGYLSHYDYDAASRPVRLIRYATAIDLGTLAGVDAPAAFTQPEASADDRVSRTLYNAAGEVLARLDAEGYLSRNIYNAGGQLVETIAYAGLTLADARASGDLAALLPAASDNDIHQYYLYDVAGRLAATVDGEKYLTEIAYDVAGNIAKRTRYASVVAKPNAASIDDLGKPSSSAADHVSSYTYSALHQLLTQTDPDGTVTRYTYDKMGNLVETRRALALADERATQTRYDALGRVIAELTPKGVAAIGTSTVQTVIDAAWAAHSVKYTYNSAGQRASVTDQDGHKSLYYYDVSGNLRYGINAAGEVSEYAYTLFNQQSSVTRINGRLSGSALAALTGTESLAAIQAAAAGIALMGANNTASASYDRLGRVIDRADALDYHKLFVYDAFGNVLSTKEQDTGITTTYQYNRRGDLTLSTLFGNPAFASSVSYDGFGRAVSRTDANGNISSLRYDKLGHVIAMTDPSNHTSKITYDAFGRVLTQTDSLEAVTTYTYALETAGSSFTMTTPEGVSHKTTQNRFGQTVTIADSLAGVIKNTTTYVYDKNGNLSSVTDSLGKINSATYDNANLQLTSSDANNSVTAYSYDAVNRILSRTVDNAGLKAQTTYAYDALGRTSRVTDPNGNVTVTSYDANGRIKSICADAEALQLTTDFTYELRDKPFRVISPGGIMTNYTYDTNGYGSSSLVMTLAHSGDIRTDVIYDDTGKNLLLRSTGQLQSSRYGYDSNNNLIWQLDPTGAVTGYTYDSKNQLIKTTRYAKLSSLFANGKPAWNKTFTAQEIEASVTADAAHDAVIRTFYDKDGRVYARVDAMGNATVYLKYNALNQPTETISYANPVALTDSTTTTSLATLLARSEQASLSDRREIAVYDARGRVTATATATSLNAAKVQQWSVSSRSYDGNGNLVGRISYLTTMATNTPTATSITSWLTAGATTSDQTVRMLYDGANRLIGSASKVSTDASYGYWAITTQAYDKNGNVLLQRSFSKKLTLALGAFPTAADLATFSTTTSNLSSSDAQTSMVYDGANRMTAIATAQTSAVAAGLASTWSVVTQAYDYNGNLSERHAYSTPLQLTGNGKVPGAAEIAAFTAIAANTSLADPRSYFVHDYAGRLTAVATAVSVAGGAIQWMLQTQTHDAMGNVISSTQHANAVDLATVSRSMPMDFPDKFADAKLDRTTKYTYDLSGRATVIVDAAGAVTRLVYDALGNVVQRIAYAAKNANPASAPGPLDRVTRIAYDKDNRPVFTIDALGAVTETRYDALGNRVASIAYAKPLSGANLQALGAITDAGQIQGMLAADPDNKDRSTQYAYDGAGRLRFTVDAAGYLSEISYDMLGRTSSLLAYATPIKATAAGLAADIAVAVADQTASARKTSYTYDAQGNLLSATEPGLPAATKSYTYDAAGRQLTYTDQLNNIWYYTYDALGRRLTEKSPAVTAYPANTVDSTMGAWAGAQVSLLTQYAYDTLGHLIRKTEAASTSMERSTTFEYDAAGRLLKTNLPSIKIYDAASDPLSSAGAATAKEKDSGIRSFSTTYDILGNAVATTDVGGVTSYSVFDQLGRLTAEIDGLGYVTAYARNSFGETEKLSRYATSLGTVSAPLSEAALALRLLKAPASDRTILTAFDQLGRAVLVREPVVEVFDQHSLGQSALMLAGRTTASRYDAFGQIIERAVYGSDTQGNIVTASAVTRYYYDLRGNTSARIDALSATPGALQGYLSTFSYDLAGNVLSKKEYSKAINDWSDSKYDAATATAGVDREARYTYDARNRMLTETSVGVSYTDNTAAAAAVAGNLTTTYAYNARGDRTTVTDALSGSTYTYYDQLGRVSGVATKSGVVAGIATAVSRLTEYKRDIQGHVVLSIEYAQGTGNATASAATPTSTSDANNRVTATAYDIDGNAIKTLDAEQYAKTDLSKRSASYISHDVYGRTAKQWQTVTSDGAVQTSYQVNQYDALGRVTGIVTPNDRSAGAGTLKDQVGYEYNGFGELVKTSLGDYYRYDQAGNAWLSNASGQDVAVLHDIMGQATVTIRSTSTTAHALQALTTATAVLSLDEVLRTDTRYDLLGHVVDVSNATGNHAQFLQQSDGNWTTTSSAINQTSAGSLLIIGRPEDSDKTFSVSYRRLADSAWTDAPSSAISWVNGYPVFSTGVLAAGDYVYQVFAQVGSEPRYQSAGGTLSVSTRATMLAQAKQIISLYLLLINRAPTQAEINLALLGMNDGKTLPQLASSLLASAEGMAFLKGSNAVATIYSKVLGKNLANASIAQEAKDWSSKLDLNNRLLLSNGEVLASLLAANSALLDRRAVALCNYLVERGGSDAAMAAKVLFDVDKLTDGAIAEGSNAARAESWRDQIVRIYVAVLGAMPSRQDTDAWVSALQTATATWQDIAQGLYNSKTPLASQGTEAGQRELIASLFKNLFGRLPTEQETNARLTQINRYTPLSAGAFAVSFMQEVASYLGADTGMALARTTLFDKVKLAQAYLTQHAGPSDATVISVGGAYIDSVVADASTHLAAGATALQLYQRLGNAQKALAAFGNIAPISATERTRLQMAALFVTVTGRAPELDEFNAGMTLLQASADGYALLANKLLQDQASAGDTLYPAGQSDGDFAAALYQSLYGQPADPATVATWSASALANGHAATVTQMLAALLADQAPASLAARELLKNKAAVAVAYAQSVSFNNIQVGKDVIARVGSSGLTTALDFGQSKRLEYDAYRQSLRNLGPELSKLSTAYLNIQNVTLLTLPPLAQAAYLYRGILNKLNSEVSAADLNSLTTTISQSGIYVAAKKLLDSVAGKALYGSELTDGQGIALAQHIYRNIMGQQAPIEPGALDYWANYLKTDVSHAIIEMIGPRLMTVPAPSLDAETRTQNGNNHVHVALDAYFSIRTLGVVQATTPGTAAYLASDALAALFNQMAAVRTGNQDVAWYVAGQPDTAQLLLVMQAMLALPGVNVDDRTITDVLTSVQGGATVESAIAALALRTTECNPGRLAAGAAVAAIPRTFAAAMYARLHPANGAGTYDAAQIDALWIQLKNATDIGKTLVALGNPRYGANTPSGVALAWESADFVSKRLTAKITELWPTMETQMAAQQAADAQLPSTGNDLLMFYALQLAMRGNVATSQLLIDGTLSFDKSLLESANTLLQSGEVQGYLSQSTAPRDFVQRIYDAFGWPNSTADIDQKTALLAGGMPHGALAVEIINSIVHYAGSDVARQARHLQILDSLHDTLASEQTLLVNYPINTGAVHDAADVIADLPLGSADIQLLVAGRYNMRASIAGSLQPTITVDRWGNVLSMADARDPNWKISYTYNYRNEQIDQTANALAGGDPAEFHTQQKYDALGRLVATIDANGNLNRQGYDANGNVVSETHADGGVVTSTFNLFGQRLSVKQPAGAGRYYAYDHLGHLLRTWTEATLNIYVAANDFEKALTATNTAAQQLVDAFTYDELGRRVSTTDASLVVTKQRYNLNGDVIKTTDGMGYVTTSSYDGQHRLTGQTDANGKSQSWVFDTDGRLTASYDMAGNVTHYSYNASGQLVQQTSSKGQDIRYTYSGMAVTRIEDKGTGLTTDYTYDAAGNRLTEKQTYAGWVAVRPEHVQNNVLSYDKQNRLISVKDDQYKLTYSYDRNGNRTKMRTEYTGEAAAAVSFYALNTYDSMNRQLIVNGEEDAQHNIVFGQYGHQIVYDKSGNRLSDTFRGVKITQSGSTYLTAEGQTTTETYTYDGAGRLATVKRDALMVDTRHYDAVGRTVESGFLSAPVNASINAAAAMIGLAAEKQTYAYDANGRMTRQVSRTLGEAGTTGNMVVTDIKYLTGAGANGYDKVGNLLGYTVANLAGATTDQYAFEYDINSVYAEKYVRLNNASSTSSIYDVNGQRTSVSKLNPETGASSVTNYWYDADGHIQSRKAGDDTTFSLIVNGNVLGNETRKEGNFLGQNYMSATAAAYSAAPTLYTTQAGDTLRDIAQRIWGDASLWYMIGDLNGIGSGTVLAAGRVLKIPQRITTIHNDYRTHRPYSAGEASGDTMPLGSPGNGDSCGVMGGIVTTTIAIAASYIGTGKLNEQAIDYLTHELGSADAARKAMEMAKQLAVNVVSPMLNGGSAKAIANDFLSNVLGRDSSSYAVQQAFTKYGSTLATSATAARALLVQAANNGAYIRTALKTAFDWSAIARAQAQAAERAAARAERQAAADEAARLAAKKTTTNNTADKIIIADGQLLAGNSAANTVADTIVNNNSSTTDATTVQNVVPASTDSATNQPAQSTNVDAAAVQTANPTVEYSNPYGSAGEGRVGYEYELDTQAAIDFRSNYLNEQWDENEKNKAEYLNAHPSASEDEINTAAWKKTDVWLAKHPFELPTWLADSPDRMDDFMAAATGSFSNDYYSSQNNFGSSVTDWARNGTVQVDDTPIQQVNDDEDSVIGEVPHVEVDSDEDGNTKDESVDTEITQQTTNITTTVVTNDSTKSESITAAGTNPGTVTVTNAGTGPGVYSGTALGISGEKYPSSANYAVNANDMKINDSVIITTKGERPSWFDRNIVYPVENFVSQVGNALSDFSHGFGGTEQLINGVLNGRAIVSAENQANAEQRSLSSYQSQSAAENLANGWVEDGLSTRRVGPVVTAIGPEQMMPSRGNAVEQVLARSINDGVPLVAADILAGVALAKAGQVISSFLSSETKLNYALSQEIRVALDADLPMSARMNGLSPQANGASSVESSSISLVRNKFPGEALDPNGKIFGEAISKDGRISIDGRPNLPKDVDFVITSDSRLVLGQKHTTLANNEDVLAAGQMKLSGRGDIRQIDNLSGHYRPTSDEALRVPDMLNNMGFKTTNSYFKLYDFTVDSNGFVTRTNLTVNRQLK